MKSKQWSGSKMASCRQEIFRSLQGYVHACLGCGSSYPFLRESPSEILMRRMPWKAFSGFPKCLACVFLQQSHQRPSGPAAINLYMYRFLYGMCLWSPGSWLLEQLKEWRKARLPSGHLRSTQMHQRCHYWIEAILTYDGVLSVPSSPPLFLRGPGWSYKRCLLLARAARASRRESVCMQSLTLPAAKTFHSRGAIRALALDKRWPQADDNLLLPLWPVPNRKEREKQGHSVLAPYYLWRRLLNHLWVWRVGGKAARGGQGGPPFSRQWTR